jgi:sterol desaturase/sphingolipid hydroxylase (fatty acid hydroxylase superfamily)
MADGIQEILKNLYPFALALSFALVYAAEHIFPDRKVIGGPRHDLINVGYGILNLTIAVAGGFLLQIWLTYTAPRLSGLINYLPKAYWVRFTISFLIIDVFMYWWQFHRFHHLDQQMNSTTAIRFHAVEMLLSYLLRLLLFPLLGIEVNMIVSYSAVFFPIVVLHHSNINIAASIDKALRAIFVTPFLHRIHHSKLVAETNSNYGSVFPWWDVVFGTFKQKSVTNIEFGAE